MADKEIRSPELDRLAFFLANLMSNCQVTPEGEVYETKALVDKIGSLRIYIYSREHQPPHFHVKCQEKQASYIIESCELLAGSLGKKEDKFVKYFHEQRKQELMDIWQKTRTGDCAVGLYTTNRQLRK